MWDQQMKCCEDVESWRTKTSVWKSTFPCRTSFSNKKIPGAPNLPVSHNHPTTLKAENRKRYRSTKNCRPSVYLRLAPRNCSIPINSHINMWNSTAEKKARLQPARPHFHYPSVFVVLVLFGIVVKKCTVKPIKATVLQLCFIML